MSDIQWFDNGNQMKRSKADVTIKVCKYTSDKKCTAITFRNNSHLKITHEDYMQVGIDAGENRVCFREGVGTGYKIGKNGNNKHIRIPALLHEYEGDYDLRMAASGDYFYVKKEN